MQPSYNWLFCAPPRTPSHDSPSMKSWLIRGFRPELGPQGISSPVEVPEVRTSYLFVFSVTFLRIRIPWDENHHVSPPFGEYAFLFQPP